MVFKSNKLVFTRNDMYAGKEYRAKGFEMNIMTLLWDFSNNNKIKFCVYLL